MAPTQDFSGFFTAFQKNILIVSLATLFLFIPFSFLFASRLSKKVTDLTAAAEQVRNLNFDVEKIEESRIVEFDDLIQSFSHMSTSLGEKTEALKTEQEKLSRLVELGISMSSEKSGDKLMEMVMIGAKDLTNADGCSLYVINDNQELDFKIFRNDTLGMVYGGTSGKKVNFPGIPLYHENGEPNLSNVVSYAVHNKESVNIADVHSSKRFDFTGPKAFDEKMGYESKSILTVPLKPRGGAVIGALQIINAQEKYADEYVAFGQDIQPFVEALAAQASTSLYNRQLLAAQEELMDALIQLIAGAIDAKSPYTGGHCERVPELAIMLAQKASETTDGSFADFAFETHDEWREFEIGAWLHDCGKVVTPEYVVDKATKLETIYNRIHEVRTRFEVLLRDARITYLEALADGTDEASAAKEFDTTRQQLFDDFAFIGECNVGSEFMSDASIERLKKIAQIQWKRHFDIHVGLSHEEDKRYVDEPHGECLEYLLDDKAFHVFPRNEGVKELYADRGFKLDVPDNLYDQGEVYNLSIQRGTLNEEERFKINEHIMQSIAMLEQLPLPDHLKRVPEYAGTHHETMIGTGYPRKLSAADLSIPSRIMAIADIFEALTASDRPYKKAKTLSESIKILSFFKKDQHIDAELFDLFLTSGIYKDYANKFLRPEQIDEVDITPYLG
ncbi:MAG: GAF domain-containing protein [Methylocystaceae bacterium]|nr:GAF domain-containing protein [Methylocystaceae bacterium]